MNGCSFKLFSYSFSHGIVKAKKKEIRCKYMYFFDKFWYFCHISGGYSVIAARHFLIYFFDILKSRAYDKTGV